MAETAEGAQLSRTFRQTQIALRAAVIRDLDTLWALFDPAAPESYEKFAEIAGSLIRSRYSDSAGLASLYYRQFVEAEGIASRVIPLPAPPLDPNRIRTSLYATGFAGTDRALRAGKPIEAAKANGFVAVSGAGSRLALEGGRKTITGTIGVDGAVAGYRRVTSGKACDFCTMLAGRGAVYGEASADFDAHDHCSCTAEPVAATAPRNVTPPEEKPAEPPPRASNLNRRDVNHGHASLVDGQWQPTFQSWCPSCRAEREAGHL